MIDRPPASAYRLRSGPSAALWKRPPATTGAAVTIGHVVAILGEVERGPETPPVAEVVEKDDAPTRLGRAVQHVVDREDVRAVHPGEPIDQRERALEPGPCRPGSGRDDDLVRGCGGHHVRVRLHAEPDLDPERTRAAARTRRSGP